MLQDEPEDTSIYKVVINHEEQYSIWPADRESPLGWTDVGKSGPKSECLAYIKEVWTDMRPLSLRKKMNESEKQDD
jgi:MbtH protein